MKSITEAGNILSQGADDEGEEYGCDDEQVLEQDSGSQGALSQASCRRWSEGVALTR